MDKLADAPPWELLINRWPTELPFVKVTAGRLTVPILLKLMLMALVAAPELAIA